MRKEIFSNKQLFTYVNPKTGKSQTEQIGKWAKRVTSTEKFSKFLARLVDWLEVKCVLETGTAAGINAITLSATKAHKIITIEGSSEVATLAKTHIAKFGNDKITLINDTIQKAFTPTLVKYEPELIFLDADHRSETITFYLEEIAKMPIPPKCILIHDIYWSDDMLTVWKKVISDPQYPLTVDLFEVGLIFPERQMHKQHFKIKF